MDVKSYISHLLRPYISYLLYNLSSYVKLFNKNIKSLLDEVKKLYNDNLELFLKCVLKYTIDEPKEINKIVNIIKEGLQYKFWTKKILHNLSWCCNIISKAFDLTINLKQ